MRVYLSSYERRAVRKRKADASTIASAVGDMELINNLHVPPPEPHPDDKTQQLGEYYQPIRDAREGVITYSDGNPIYN
jgi:hypothetical protein